MTHLLRPQAAAGLVVALFVVAGTLAGCQSDTDSTLDRIQDATDRAQAWVEKHRDLARDVDQMWSAYEQGNTEEAAQALDRVRDRVNWDEGLLANDSLRTRLLEGGTQIYEALDRPEQARAFIEDALPHLDGATRERWQQALQAYEEAAAQNDTRTAE